MTGLPSENVIAELPRWAIVAWGARTARRVIPQYYSHRHDPAVEQAVALAEWMAAAAEEEPEAAVSASAASAEAMRAARLTRTASERPHEPSDAVAAAARSAARSAAAAANAADAARLLRQSSHSDRTETACVRSALRAAQAAVDSACDQPARLAMLHAISTDFMRLKHLALSESWHDDTAVTPEVLGSIWPDEHED